MAEPMYAHITSPSKSSILASISEAYNSQPSLEPWDEGSHPTWAQTSEGDYRGSTRYLQAVWVALIPASDHRYWSTILHKDSLSKSKHEKRSSALPDSTEWSRVWIERSAVNLCLVELGGDMMIERNKASALSNKVEWQIMQRRSGENQSEVM